jgi:hypothetical protein
MTMTSIFSLLPAHQAYSSSQQQTFKQQQQQQQPKLHQNPPSAGADLWCKSYNTFSVIRDHDENKLERSSLKFFKLV